MRSSYAKGMVLVLALLVLAVEGYFGYRWYQRYYQAPTDTTASSVSGGDEVAVPEQPNSEDGGADALVHRATPRNIMDNSTYIDHPASNGNPDAILFVTQAWSSDGTPTNPHPTGVWYDANRGGRWAVFNQDLAAMPENAVFNVLISEEPGDNAFVHRATPANTDGDSTFIDHPLANASPESVLSATPNWNPGGINGTYHAHFVGVRYDADQDEGRWAIRSEDLAIMPGDAAFNVFIRRGAEDSGR